MYRMLSLPGRLPCTARPPNAREIHWTAVFDSRRCAGDAPARYRGSDRGIAKHAGDRLLQHHKMLLEGLPRKHSNHRQRNHSAEGTRSGRFLRSVWLDLEKTQKIAESLKRVKKLKG